MASGILLLVAGIIVLVLGLTSLFRNPRLLVSRSFFASMLFAGAFDISLFSLLVSPDRSSAVLLSRLLLFTMVLAAGANIFLANSLSPGKGESWTKDHPAFSSLVVLVMASAAGLSGDAVPAPAPHAFTVPDASWSLSVLLGGGLVCMSIWMMHSARKASTDPHFRRASQWLGVAFALPAVSLSAVFGDAGSAVIAMVASTASFLSAAVYAYVGVRYRTFTQVPVAIKADDSSEEDSMSPGSSLLVEGKGTATAYGLFLAEVRRGGEGMVISRKHPGQVREMLGSENAAVLWLCTQPGSEKIDPSSLTLLQGTISDFLRKDKRSVVLLDGLEYLVSENRPDKVLRLIYGVKDVATVSGSKLIIPLDPETLDEKDLAFFEREFKVLRPGADQAGPGHTVAVAAQ